MAIHMTRTGVALTVGIILVTGLIVGGLYLVKEQGEQARREEAIAIAEENLEDQADEGIALNDGTTDSGEMGSADTETTGDGVAPEATDSAQLPQTGPSDGLVFLLVGVATYLGAAFYQSRKL